MIFILLMHLNFSSEITMLYGMNDKFENVNVEFMNRYKYAKGQIYSLLVFVCICMYLSYIIIFESWSLYSS